MKILPLASLALFGVLSAGTAGAARSGANVLIADITIVDGDARISFVTGIGGTAPSCGSAHPNHFGIDLTSASGLGPAQLSLAMAAMLAGKTVNVVGTSNGDSNACIFSDFDAQRLRQITINP